MNKFFVVASLSDLNGVCRQKKIRNALVIGFRSRDKFHSSNISGDVRVSFCEINEELVFRVKLKDGDYVALGDHDGKIEKVIVQKD